MVRVLFIMCINFFVINYIYAAEILAEDEIKSAKYVEFEDYRGRPSIRNSQDQIRGIGNSLSKAPFNKVVNYANKYSIYKVRANSDEYFNADILSLLNDAKVNTIREVRNIVAGFLTSSYGYNSNDSLALATFITYYNGFYRSNLGYVKEKYNKEVIEQLIEDKLGIAKSYKEWPGKTQILIPLSSILGNVDTLEVGNINIKNALKKENGKGIDEREAINNMQDKQIESERKTLEAEELEINRQKELLDSQRKKLEAEFDLSKEKAQQDRIKKLLEENARQRKKLAFLERELIKKKARFTTNKQQVATDREDIKKDKKIVNSSLNRTANVKSRFLMTPEEREQADREAQEKLYGKELREF